MFAAHAHLLGLPVLTSVTPVSYRALGTQTTGSGSPTAHATPIAGDTIVVWASVQGTGVTSSATCKIGASTNVPLLAGPFTGGNSVYIFAYGLIGPPVTGSSQAITFASLGSSLYCAVNAVLYQGVDNFGTPTHLTATKGTSGAAAQSASTTDSNGMVAAGWAGNTTFSAPSGQTTRINIATAAFVNDALFAGDAAGSASGVTLTLSSSGAFGGIAVPLNAAA